MIIIYKYFVVQRILLKPMFCSDGNPSIPLPLLSFLCYSRILKPNFNSTEIEKQYGLRVRRMREVFIFISFLADAKVKRKWLLLFIFKSYIKQPILFFLYCIQKFISNIKLFSQSLFHFILKFGLL